MKTAVSDATKTLKKTASDAGRKILWDEPLEMAKDISSQVTGSERQVPSAEALAQGGQGALGVSPQEAARMEERRQSSLKALEFELQEIRQNRKKREQEEQAPQPQEPEKPFVEPSPKRSRKLFRFGQKEKAQSLQTQTEKPIHTGG